MELEEDYTREKGSGRGAEIGYTVEARLNYHEPAKISGQIFDNRWRRVEFEKGAIGVPSCSRYQRHVAEHGMLGYAAAQALRWWLHANAEVEQSSALCLETRLISHRISYTHKIEAQAAHGHIHGGDRSNCIPDWGKSNDKEQQK